MLRFDLILLPGAAAALILRRGLGLSALDPSFIWWLTGVLAGTYLLLYAAVLLASPDILLSRLRPFVERWRRARPGSQPSTESPLDPDEPVVVHTGDGALRPWQWKLRETRAGPDHCARLCFVESIPRLLPSAVGRGELAGFDPFHYVDAEGLYVLRYVDRFNAPAFAGNLSGYSSRNIWTYRTVEVRGSRLMFANGYGTWDPETLTAQTALLYRLCTSEAGLTLADWSIFGNESGVVAQGVGWGELLLHLRLDAEG